MWIAASLAALFAAAAQPIPTRLEVIGDLSAAESAELATQLRAAIEERTGRAVLLEPGGGRCLTIEECKGQLPGSAELLLVKVFAGPLRIRVVAEHAGPASAPVARTEEEMPKERSFWRAAFDRMAAQLLPAPEAPASALTPPPATRTREDAGASASAAPWIVLGASALALAAGGALGLASSSASDSVVSARRDPDELRDLLDRSRTTALGANLCFGAAAAGAVSALVLLVLE